MAAVLVSISIHGVIKIMVGVTEALVSKHPKGVALNVVTLYSSIQKQFHGRLPQDGAPPRFISYIIIYIKTWRHTVA
jgi:hypothetical protein